MVTSSDLNASPPTEVGRENTLENKNTDSVTPYASVTLDHDRFQFLHNGAYAYEALDRLIAGAKHSLYLEMYIYRADATGARVKAALLAACGRGVRVRLLLDSFGAGELPKNYFAELFKFDTELRWFNPSRVLRVAFRDHRKLCVVDHRRAIVGGFNIGNEYTGDGIAQGWRDLGMQIDGPLALELSESFDRMFIAARMDTSAFLMFVRGQHRKHRVSTRPALLTAGPGFGGASLRRILYRDIVRSRRVDAAAAYFAPTWALRRRLLNAASRGLVRLVLPGKTDVAVLRFAAQHLYSRLLAKGIQIFEYQPQIMHTKLLIVDDVVYVGSCNLDTRSLRINFELLVRIPSAELAAQARKIIETDMQHSEHITKEQWQAADTSWRRWLRQIAYWLVVRLDPFLARRKLRALR